MKNRILWREAINFAEWI